YDLNYRATLMTTEEARAMLAAVAPHLELLVVAERDARAVLGFAEEAERLAEAIAAGYGEPLGGLTRGPTAHGLDPGPPGSDHGDLLFGGGKIRYAPRY